MKKKTGKKTGKKPAAKPAPSTRKVAPAGRMSHLYSAKSGTPTIGTTSPSAPRVPRPL